MPEYPYPKNEYLSKVIALIEANLSDENFGVEELAEEIGMSRSNLLRRVKTATGLSVSVLIREVRLLHARELLQDASLNVSEIAFRVGFNSTSYFTKCFREQFGYPPGEESQRSQQNDKVEKAERGFPPKKKVAWITPVIIISIAAAVILYLVLKNTEAVPPLHKSIAVLPFKNDSNDSSNLYLVNGLMEAVIDNLHKIEDLEVTSRTTVEKYRNITRTIPELANELEVNYFVEGSGQKIDDQLLLTIQLIEAKTDKHLWSKRYQRQAKDIFKLQAEVSLNIANEIEAIITPEEELLIEKIPTENLLAYDFYLQGVEQANLETTEGLLKAIDFFDQALAEDDEFAEAYAYLAICYYYLDIFQTEKKYGQEINTNSDKALLYDSEQPLSLYAKALFYMHDAQYTLAAEYFEKMLVYAPYSAQAHNRLSEIYTSYLPNTKKYLSHALRGIKTVVVGQDSITASFTFLHLSNALAQSGFIKEAEVYIQKSLAYYPDNLFSEYLYTYLKLAMNFNLQVAKNELIATLAKDTTRVDIIQEVAKVSYTLGEYETSWSYYEKMIAIKNAYDLDIYQGEDAKIAYVLQKLGRTEEAAFYLERYLTYAENDESIYKNLSLSAYNATIGNIDAGIEYLKAFSEEENYQYWFILFLEKDPIIMELASHPDFKPTVRIIEDKFWAQHDDTKQMLINEGVIID
jgi:TolB-like protein/AraC-like DNA-binding protein